MVWKVEELSEFKSPRPTYRSQVMENRLNAGHYIGRTYSKG